MYFKCSFTEFEIFLLQFRLIYFTGQPHLEIIENIIPSLTAVALHIKFAFIYRSAAGYKRIFAERQTIARILIPGGCKRHGPDKNCRRMGSHCQ